MTDAPPIAQPAVVGVDGYRKGWIAAIDEGDGTRIEAFREFSEIAARPEFVIIVVDISIGLLGQGARQADTEARHFLRGRASCVFNAPIRPILEAPNQAAASAIWRKVEGKGFSAQGFRIVKQVAEVDLVIRRDLNIQQRVYEGHPEVTFALMNSRRPVTTRKHDRAGEADRLALLEPEFGIDVRYWLSRYPRYARTDVIDAYAMLWTARRLRSHAQMVRLPEHAQKDTFGLSAQIVA